MKILNRLFLTALAGMAMMSSASAGSPVARVLIRDANGQARVAYVRVADKRILYPRVIQQIAKPGGQTEYRPALSSNYRPKFQGGFAGHRPPYGYGYYPNHGNGNPPVAPYASYYRPISNSGVDGYLHDIALRNAQNQGGWQRPCPVPVPAPPARQIFRGKGK